MFNENTTRELKKKLLILYILNEVSTPMTMGEIEDIVLPTKLIELLMIAGLLDSLVQSNMVEILEGKYELYSITEEGRESITIFDDKINDYHRKQLNEKIGLFKREKKNAKFISAEYKKISENASVVDCVINEGDSPLIELKVRVPSNEHADRMVKLWKKDALDIFQKIIKIFEVE